MAEFMTVMREYSRMCDGDIECNNCPISASNNGIGIACRLFMRKAPGKAESIIMKWAAEHPIMTNGKKFEEVFGFNPATVFEVNRGNIAWLDEEYTGGDPNEG